MIKKLIKLYLKRIPRSERSVRMLFLGKRLKMIQHLYLHFSHHPWDKV